MDILTDRELVDKVTAWARVNRPDDYCYGTRRSYWMAAKLGGFISEMEYRRGERHYGALWTYRGD